MQKEFLLILIEKKAERLSPYSEPTQKDIPLIRGQCRTTFLYAKPMWNDKKL
jgi:hypothetical protein